MLFCFTLVRDFTEVSLVAAGTPGACYLGLLLSGGYTGDVTTYGRLGDTCGFLCSM